MPPSSPASSLPAAPPDALVPAAARTEIDPVMVAWGVLAGAALWVFGYTAYNDVSARGLGRSGIISFLGKSFDTFAAFGPWIVTRDELPDPQTLRITVDVNGERRQDYATSDMERPVPELMTYISSVTTLHPGDVICCGTNHQGLGAMQDGDAVVTAVSGIGSFTVHVRDDLERTWQRGIDRAAGERVKAAAQHPVAASARGGAAG